MFRGRDVISILDFSREELEELFEAADRMVELGRAKLLEGRILAIAFFEPSTRTRLSFESAMIRLGGSIIDLGEIGMSSIAKGESLADTIRMLDSYSDAIVVRHGIEGFAKFAAEIADVPIINAGDGSQHHPTQAMLDLYTIRRERGSINGIEVAVLGDLKYGRAATSFIYGLTKFEVGELHLVSPPTLRIRPEVRAYIDGLGIRYSEANRLNDVIGEVDVLYVTRIQKERFPDPAEYEKVRGSYRIDMDLLRNAKEGLMILHPLPRVDEIDHSVDRTRFAYYFRQASYGVPVRMALLALILGGIYGARQAIA